MFAANIERCLSVQKPVFPGGGINDSYRNIGRNDKGQILAGVFAKYDCY